LFILYVSNKLYKTFLGVTKFEGHKQIWGTLPRMLPDLSTTMLIATSRQFSLNINVEVDF